MSDLIKNASTATTVENSISDKLTTADMEVKEEQAQDAVETSQAGTEVGAQATSISKEQAVENAKLALQEARDFLADNAGRDQNIVKVAEQSVKKAERIYSTALKATELPTIPVEFWTVTESDETKGIINKEAKSIIIAISDYSMSVTKVGVEFGKGLIVDERYEQDNSSYLVKADIFYQAKEQLTDLNGNPVPQGTPDVYVPVDMAGDFWKWATYHQFNIDAMVSNGSPLVIKNVRLKEFKDLQDYAKYRGVNNVLSRGMNGQEKAGNAALATQNEFYTKIFKVAKEMKSNISTITKYYNLGKILNGKVWNDAMVGYMDEKFKYDLSVGDNILETLHSVGFENKFLKERYMIGAITELAAHKPKGMDTPVGLKEVLATIESLEKDTVKFITSITENKQSEIYSALLTQYLNNKGLIDSAA